MNRKIFFAALVLMFSLMSPYTFGCNDDLQTQTIHDKTSQALNVIDQTDLAYAAKSSTATGLPFIAGEELATTGFVAGVFSTITGTRDLVLVATPDEALKFDRYPCINCPDQVVCIDPSDSVTVQRANRGEELTFEKRSLSDLRKGERVTIQGRFMRGNEPVQGQSNAAFVESCTVVQYLS